MLLLRRLVSGSRWRQLSTTTGTDAGNDVIFSGIQPTGIPHIGNYLGAIKQWARLQDDNDVIYCIVDLHAITRAQDGQTLRHNIQNMAACMLACGLDPDKSLIFQQSSVSQHTELAWVLSCMATLSQLSHQPQWRHKSASLANPGVGLYTYPLLQSADILLYQATKVPVGEDQIKHIELTRHLARTFNKRYHTNMFPEPDVILTSGNRIRSLRKPSDKMSKSDENDRSRIEITDTDDAIRTKIQKAVTDTLGTLTFDPESRPGVANLLAIHGGFTDKNPEEICKECKEMNMSTYKRHLTDVVVQHLAPIRDEYQRLSNDRSYVEQVLLDGATGARTRAERTLNVVKQLIGFS